MRGRQPPAHLVPDQTSSFANIKALGANTVRVVLAAAAAGRRTTPPTSPTSSPCARQNRLICVLEVHDTTGYGEQSGAVTLDQAVDYWISSQSALVGQENYVIINIGNEPFGNNAVTPSWTAADRATRSAGCAPPASTTRSWSTRRTGARTGSSTMRDNAADRVQRRPRPQHRLLHPHVRRVRHRRRDHRLPRPRSARPGCRSWSASSASTTPTATPTRTPSWPYTQANGIGYLGWSWSGNGGGVEYLDMVTNFDPAQLTTWGQRIFNGANGIRATAREATIFGGGRPDHRRPRRRPPPRRRRPARRRPAARRRRRRPAAAPPPTR